VPPLWAPAVLGREPWRLARPAHACSAPTAQQRRSRPRRRTPERAIAGRQWLPWAWEHCRQCDGDLPELPVLEALPAWTEPSELLLTPRFYPVAGP